MSRVAILGAGAFGTALAVALARGGARIDLVARTADEAARIAGAGENARRLPGVRLPETVSVSAENVRIADADAILFAVPMQALAGVLPAVAPHLGAAPLVACCKGVDLATLQGPTALLTRARGAGVHAVLTGPSFAGDIARGLPTALTLACGEDDAGARLQALLSTPTLRLYRTTDTIGAELGGALKNVIAIAAGIVIGAGLGDSARAALMTRGYAEMVRFATRLGAQPETLAGLSGLGDLVLTCTSEQSRNFRHGLALGRGAVPDPEATVEGLATAQAVLRQAVRLGIAGQIPITAMVAAVTTGQTTISEAVQALMSRPLKQE